MAQELPEQLYIGKVRLKALIEHNGRVLILRNFKKPHWDLPGGRLHKNEEVKKGLAREVKEELGVDIEVGEAMFADTSPDDHFAVVFKATLLNPAASFTFAPDEVDEVKWITKEEVESASLWDEYRRALNIYFGVQ